jgi:hypothetical protein
LKTKYYCNPDFKGECEFRGENRECNWKYTCNQKRIIYREKFLKIRGEKMQLKRKNLNS